MLSTLFGKVFHQSIVYVMFYQKMGQMNWHVITYHIEVVCHPRIGLRTLVFMHSPSLKLCHVIDIQLYCW